jgi:V/A-type H+-transporting ATPase subunit F
MSENVAFIGNRESVAGFIPLGLAAYPVTDRSTAVEALNDCLKSGFAVLFVTEEIAELLADEIRAVRFRPTPAILVVPSTLGSTGLGLRRLRTLVEKAVGADILSRENSVPQSTDRNTGE